YVLSANIYHCLALTNWYTKNCNAYANSHQKMGMEGDRSVTPSRDPFFEFEALVTAIVRGFDTLRYALWKKWGGRGTTPSSYEKVLGGLQKCPEPIFKRLCLSATESYTQAKKYRHCIQHYVDMGSGSWAMFERTPSRAWSVIVRVPDNPEARSSNKWQFSQNLDALSMGWELCTELFCIVAISLGHAHLCLGERDD
ncbi:MAG TPA: hypothetical protein VHD85_08865, partial [Terracidiphilus sp.]|nr:hypothetical protein [Terracidiphilus sp.]